MSPSGTSKGLSVDHGFSNSPCSSLVQQRMPRPQVSPFAPGRWFGDIKSPALKLRGVGFWGCLQMMKVVPKISRSSSPADVVHSGSPENRWLGHWASIRHRIVSRRTARVMLEENRSSARSQICQDLGSHPTLNCPCQEEPSYLQDSSLAAKGRMCILLISEHHQRETPLLTKQ